MGLESSELHELGLEDEPPQLLEVAKRGSRKRQRPGLQVAIEVLPGADSGRGPFLLMIAKSNPGRSLHGFVLEKNTDPNSIQDSHLDPNQRSTGTRGWRLMRLWVAPKKIRGRCGGEGGRMADGWRRRPAGGGGRPEKKTEGGGGQRRRREHTSKEAIQIGRASCRERVSQLV